MEESVIISVRLSQSQLKEIDEIARKKNLGRSAIIRELILEGLRVFKTKEVLEMLRERKISVWKAAKILNITYREMLRLLKEYNVPFPLSSKELLEELEDIERSQ